MGAIFTLIDDIEKFERFLDSLSPEELIVYIYLLNFYSPQAIEERRIQNHNQNLLYKLQVGDLVEFDRQKYMNMYQHWAVYIGHGEVVHRTGDLITGCTSCCPSKDAEIKREDFWKVAKGSQAKKGNKDDRKYCPLPAEDIRRKALRCVGQDRYHLLQENCEHFAKRCRYGEGRSEQVVKLANFVYVATCIVLCVLVPIVANYYLAKMSDEFQANLIFVMSLSVAVIPVATWSYRIPWFSLFTMIVVSGGIGYVHVFATSIKTASIVVTSLVIIGMASWNYCTEAKGLMLTTGAIVALGTVEAASGVFGQRIVLTACTMLTALAAITTNNTVKKCCFKINNLLFFFINDTSAVIEITALILALHKTNVFKAPKCFLAAIFSVFRVSFPLRVIINTVCFFDFYNSMIDAIKLNTTALLIYILMKLQPLSIRHSTSSRLPFLLTLILHWVLYDPELVSQAMDNTILWYTELFLGGCFVVVLLVRVTTTCWNAYYYRAKQNQFQGKRRSLRLFEKANLKAEMQEFEVAQGHQDTKKKIKIPTPQKKKRYYKN